jgi:hypothetical protein
MDNNSNNPTDNQPAQAPANPPVSPAVPEPTQPVPEMVPPAPAQPEASAPTPPPTTPEVPAPVTPAVPQAQLPDLTAIFDQIAEKIIEQQEAIIGPIAVEQAKLVTELNVDWSQHDVDIEGSPQVAIDDLVAQYKELFGQIAVETCREAVSKLLAQVPADQQPSSLKNS